MDGAWTKTTKTPLIYYFNLVSLSLTQLLAVSELNQDSSRSFTE